MFGTGVCCRANVPENLMHRICCGDVYVAKWTALGLSWVVFKELRFRVLYLVHPHQSTFSHLPLLLIHQQLPVPVMSNEHTLHLVDAEKGNHEPWSLQMASDKDTLPNTPSSQTLALNYKPSLVFSPQKESRETKIEAETPPKPKAAPKPPKKVSKWILWRLWFNTYR